MPDYADGHVEYPSAAWDSNGRWSAPAADPDICDVDGAALGEWGRVHVDVWRAGAKGEPPTLVKSEATTMQREDIAGKAMDCPYVPVLDDGKIEHVLLKDPDICMEPDPQADQDKASKPS